MPRNCLSSAEAGPSPLVGEFYIWRQNPPFQWVQEAASFSPRWPHTGTPSVRLLLLLLLLPTFMFNSVPPSPRLAEWTAYQTQTCVSPYTSIKPVWPSSKDWESMTLRSTTVSTEIFRLFCLCFYPPPVKYQNININILFMTFPLLPLFRIITALIT